MPKITHLLIALPNPSDKFIKDLNSIFFNFLWHGKTPKVKKEVLFQDMNKGGLRMIKLQSFIFALKTTWIT